MAPFNIDKLLLSEIWDKVEAVFGYRPCLWQLKVIVVTPLNILRKQNVDSLAKVGISVITITGDTATAENFRAIAEGRHRAIVTNIETLMNPGGGFEALWANKAFASKVISIVWDEAQHPFYITSATLPPDFSQDVMATLGMRESHTEIFTRSNDHSNIHITVRKMKYAINSFKDLRFLIPPDWDGTTPLPYKFTIFFDTIAESIAAAEYLRSLVPFVFRDKIKWFNSEMSPEFRADESDKFNQGLNYGLSCTESFGMGIDLPNITVVIQWRATCDMCTLWQRFGRGFGGFSG
ncbi:P-loop containing nucleoside triphosphate hydrolase protein [Mycena rosella]|uniref:DNA 3'-5' helicase n=1 Tax=Mycena rosella TaxID=1033263 RepID=A0AAD7D8I7_MYCRO|nr:P-loop containing nucleoside triphosphate hydrolase protein [Mycena rosella]